MRPLFSSENFIFMGSSGGELFVECAKCNQEASLEMKAPEWYLTVSCQKCGVTENFRFRGLEVTGLEKSVSAS
jgi:hypothetical protein